MTSARFSPAAFLAKLREGDFATDDFATGDLAADRFASDRPSVSGVVKPSEEADNLLFSPGPDCKNWVSVPAELIEHVELFQVVQCEDHSYPLVNLTFKDPTTSEARTFAAIAALTSNAPSIPESLEAIRMVIDADEPVFAGALGEFLQLLERAFVAVSMQGQTLPFQAIYQSVVYGDPRLRESLDDEFERIWDELPIWAERTAHYVLSHDSPRNGLRLLTLSKNSPIEMIAVGLPFALTAAAIFSGGQVKLPGFEARLPPLGVGIKALRNALGLAGPRQKLPRGTLHHSIEASLAVGTPIAERPPHRSERARFGHSAPTSGV
jgi:hypothetical protein